MLTGSVRTIQRNIRARSTGARGAGTFRRTRPVFAPRTGPTVHTTRKQGLLSRLASGVRRLFGRKAR